MAIDFLSDYLKRHREDFIKSSETTPFIVFLCGPTIKDLVTDPSHPKYDAAAVLRKSIKEELESNGFQVVLGEDEGLEDPRLEVGRDAQDNELTFITKFCNAVVIVAGSVGSFCELGLFSWHFAHPDGTMKMEGPEKDLVLLVEERFKQDKSYFNEGPAKIVSAFGETNFVDFENFDMAPLVERFSLRKAMVKKRPAVEPGQP